MSSQISCLALLVPASSACMAWPSQISAHREAHARPRPFSVEAPGFSAPAPGSNRLKVLRNSVLLHLSRYLYTTYAHSTKSCTAFLDSSRKDTSHIKPMIAASVPRLVVPHPPGAKLAQSEHQLATIHCSCAVQMLPSSCRAIRCSAAEHHSAAAWALDEKHRVGMVLSAII